MTSMEVQGLGRRNFKAVQSCHSHRPTTTSSPFALLCFGQIQCQHWHRNPHNPVECSEYSPLQQATPRPHPPPPPPPPLPGASTKTGTPRTCKKSFSNTSQKRASTKPRQCSV